ncbi:MAG: hypothetical protein HQM04_16715 [Magnetococcales bacterium]|nr:hypothetical protein [Magnetococcales bacterium]MBF0116673.1 hypothetical protein [Magnetococcales bacterium]
MALQLFQVGGQGQPDGNSASARSRTATVRLKPDHQLGNAFFKELLQPSQPPEPQLETQQQLKLMMMPTSGKIKICVGFVSKLSDEGYADGYVICVSVGLYWGGLFLLKVLRL